MGAQRHGGTASASTGWWSPVVRTLSRSPAALGLLLLVQAAVLWTQLNDHAFVYDDLFYMLLARSAPDLWTWVTSDHFQHVAPLHRLWWSVQEQVDPLGYRFALAVGILGVVIGTALFKYALDLLFGRRALHLWLTALVAFNVLWLRPLQWWSAGLQIVPTFVSGMVVLIAYGKWLDRRRWVWLMVGSAAMTFGLLLYELPIGILGVLVLLRVLVLHGDLRPMAVLRLLFNERASLVVFGAPALAYIAWYAASVAPAQPGAQLRLAVLEEFFRRTWLDTLVPSLFGVVVRPDRTAIEQAVIVLCQVGFWVIVGWSLWRLRADAMRVWAWFFFIVVVKLVLVGVARLPHFDAPTVANDPRYVGEFAFLWPLALAALLRQPGAGLAGRLRHERPSSASVGGLPLVHTGVVAVVAAVYFVVALQSNTITIDEWAGERARRYQNNVELLVASPPPDGIVIDQLVPDFVMPGFAGPYNTIGHVLWMYDIPVQVDGPVRGGGLFVVSPDGSTVEVDFVARAGGRATDELRLGNLREDGGELSGQSLCLGPNETGATVFTLALPRLTLLDSYLRMTYATDTSHTVEVRVDAGSGVPPFPTTGLTVADDTTESIAWLRSPGASSIAALRFDVPAHQRLCIDRVEVGELVPAR